MLYNLDMKQSIMHVARKIVELSGDNLTPLKLQKLAYYSQAWSLVWEGKPLFEEDFQAWANGPVSQELYSKHKGLYVLDKDFLSEFSSHEFSGEDLHTIKVVLKFYGDKAPFYLSELTHRERPWKDARGETPMGESSTAVISKDVMQDYYTGISSRENG
jgi:uncharacterized phage-associated protein